MNELQKIENWRTDLILAETFEEIKLLGDAAEAAAAFARRQGVLVEKQQEIGVAIVEIARRKGEWLTEHFPKGAAPGTNNREIVKGQVAPLQISERESKAARTIARTDEGLVENIMEHIIDAGDVPTVAKVAAAIKRHNAPEKEEQLISPTVFFDKAITAGQNFGKILQEVKRMKEEGVEVAPTVQKDLAIVLGKIDVLLKELRK